MRRRHHWMAGKPKPGARRPRKEKDEKAWKKQKRKVCIFCKDRIAYVDYKDVMMLRKFVSERGKIRARRVTGNCVQHQRDVATAVKNARQMALLPYSAR
jgi:small subunit ribosomal protein S18